MEQVVRLYGELFWVSGIESGSGSAVLWAIPKYSFSILIS